MSPGRLRLEDQNAILLVEVIHHDFICYGRQQEIQHLELSNALFFREVRLTPTTRLLSVDETRLVDVQGKWG